MWYVACQPSGCLAARLLAPLTVFPVAVHPSPVSPRSDLPWLDNRFPYVAVGNHNQELDYQDDEDFLQPFLTIIHGGFNRENVTDDVALMFFKEDLVDKNGMSGHVTLPEEGYEVTDGDDGITFGWGLVQEGDSSPSSQLYGVEMTMYSIGTCQKQSLYEEGSLLPGMYCAGGNLQTNQTGLDACNGDSGGPNLNYNASNDEQSPLQVGVVSWGIGCGRDGYPGVYVELSKYVTWIAEEMEYVEDLKPSLSCFSTSEENMYVGTGSLAEEGVLEEAGLGPERTRFGGRRLSAARSDQHVIYVSDGCSPASVA